MAIARRRRLLGIVAVLIPTLVGALSRWLLLPLLRVVAAVAMAVLSLVGAPLPTSMPCGSPLLPTMVLMFALPALGRVEQLLQLAVQLRNARTIVVSPSPKVPEARVAAGAWLRSTAGASCVALPSSLSLLVCAPRKRTFFRKKSWIRINKIQMRGAGANRTLRLPLSL